MWHGEQYKTSELLDYVVAAVKQSGVGPNQVLESFSRYIPAAS